MTKNPERLLHTPGPWRFDHQLWGGSHPHDKVVLSADESGRLEFNNPADGALIEGAVGLLEACREILDVFENRRDILALVGPKEGMVIARVASAIAKARAHHD
jgi:hypothetical protein